MHTAGLLAFRSSLFCWPSQVDIFNQSQWHCAQNNSLITVAGATLALLFKTIKQRTVFPFILRFD